MNIFKYLIYIAILLTLRPAIAADGELLVKGQASCWGNYSSGALYPLQLGGRYIPQLNGRRTIGGKTADFEASLHLNAGFSAQPFDSAESRGDIKPYRLWLRYSAPRFEIRLGLQKINFGSALLLRPLMWFDAADPRDPLQLTDGAWGLLGRYYFLNNATLWLWLLRPAEQLRSWELMPSNRSHPEWGGRIQYPLPGGEIGLSGHLRTADGRALAGEAAPAGEAWTQRDVLAEISESRIGLDAKWDWLVGLWFEGAWIRSGHSPAPLRNETLLTIGSDYTFGIGNGLHLLCENLWFAAGPEGPGLDGARALAGLSLTYPLSLFDQLSAILYADWDEQELYRFASWRRQYDNLAINLMAWWNPERLLLPGHSGEGGAAFAGRGGQIMLIYNH